MTVPTIIDRSDPFHAHAHTYADYGGDRHFRHPPGRGGRPVSAAALLAEARAAGVTLRLCDGTVKVGGDPSPEFPG